jgi:hypothetical protein
LQARVNLTRACFFVLKSAPWKFGIRAFIREIV